MSKNLFEPAFLKRLSILALPIATNELLVASLQIVDTMFVGKLGGVSLAAISLANQVFFIYILVMIGITSGSGVFTAQYWGNGDRTGVKRVLGVTLVGALIASTLFTAAAFFFPEPIMAFYSSDPEVIKAGVPFLKVMAFSYLFMGVTLAFSSILRSINDTKTPMLVSVFALGVGTILNYGLIFGKFGMPEMGLVGCAVATVISRFIEMSLLVLVTYARKSPIAANFAELTDWSREFVLKLTKTSMPVFFNELGWAVGISLYAKVWASVSTQAMTAVTVAETAMYFCMVIFFGTTSATGILIGNTIGENNMERAHADSRRILILVPIMAVAVGTIAWVLSSVIPSFFSLDGATAKMTTAVIISFVLVFPFKIFNMHCVNGVLRSGGDTRYAMFMDLGCVWLIGIPFALVGAYALHLPIQWLYLLVASEEIIKSAVGFFRVKSGKWATRVIA